MNDTFSPLATCKHFDCKKEKRIKPNPYRHIHIKQQIGNFKWECSICKAVFQYDNQGELVEFDARIV
jgi:hypothetical protein